MKAYIVWCIGLIQDSRIDILMIEKMVDIIQLSRQTCDGEQIIRDRNKEDYKSKQIQDRQTRDRKIDLLSTN